MPDRQWKDEVRPYVHKLDVFLAVSIMRDTTIRFREWDRYRSYWVRYLKEQMEKERR